MEQLRRFAGQTATLSFWAKSDSSRTQQIAVVQNFGSGGSTDVNINNYGTNNFTTTTSWQRFTFTLSIPSISGKTVGSSSYLWFAIRQASASGSQLDMWGAQWEAGSVATAFQTATGSIGGELALCQRYFLNLNNSNTNTLAYGYGWFFSTTSARYMLPTPVTMRTTPTLVGALIAKGAATSLAPSTYSVYLLGQGIGIISAVIGGVQDNAICTIINTTLTLDAEL